MKRNKKTRRTPPVGSVSRSGGKTLTSYTVGSLPILDRVIRRARIEEFLGEYLREDKRCTIPPSRGVIVLLKNYLASREPLYGVGDWARQHAPEHLDLSVAECRSFNDDRVARCLDRVFEADHRSLVLATLMHVIKEFDVSLDELHNDSTTLTFSGEYEGAGKRLQPFGKATRIITWGHNKDHRPDLKQLLYTLTVTRDGAVPVNFSVGDGNLTDDQTHRDTWELVRELAGRPDFLYVADSKLAAEKNMGHIHRCGGRFITVLPRTRSEDKTFRGRLATDEVRWEPLCVRDTNEGPDDEVSLAGGDTVTKEGYRLLWFHSTRKADLDQHARGKKILRTMRALDEFEKKLASPRTRYRSEEKVRKALKKHLEKGGAEEWLSVDVHEAEEESFKQAGPGRPSENTQYRRETRKRFSLSVEVDHAAVRLSEKQDGVFPLISNDTELDAVEILDAYKRQASIEKRFSQLKNDYELAPIFVKSVHRIEAMLVVYFFALLVQGLLERELRRGMKAESLESLALYPEQRPCKAPTARKTIDLFEDVQRHELSGAGLSEPVHFDPDLSDAQKNVLRLLGIPGSEFRGSGEC